MPSTARAEQRRVIACAAAGMAGALVVIAILVRVSGQSWPAAAGVAALPTVFGGWYFGALLPLSHHDFSEDRPAIAASTATAVPPTVHDSAPARDERDESDAVAPAA